MEDLCNACRIIATKVKDSVKVEVRRFLLRPKTRELPKMNEPEDNLDWRIILKGSVLPRPSQIELVNQATTGCKFGINRIVDAHFSNVRTLNKPVEINKFL